MKRYTVIILVFLISCSATSCQLKYRHQVEKGGTSDQWKEAPLGFLRYDGYDQVAGDLEVAVTSYRKKGSPVEIQLVGVIHQADRDYYRKIQKILDKSDLVLCEYMGQIPPGGKGLVWTRKRIRLQAQLMGLASQPYSIEWRKHFIPCDTDFYNDPQWKKIVLAREKKIASLKKKARQEKWEKLLGAHPLYQKALKEMKKTWEVVEAMKKKGFTQQSIPKLARLYIQPASKDDFHTTRLPPKKGEEKSFRFAFFLSVSKKHPVLYKRLSRLPEKSMACHIEWKSGKVVKLSLVKKDQKGSPQWENPLEEKLRSMSNPERISRQRYRQLKKQEEIKKQIQMVVPKKLLEDYLKHNFSLLMVENHDPYKFLQAQTREMVKLLEKWGEFPARDGKISLLDMIYFNLKALSKNTPGQISPAVMDHYIIPRNKYVMKHLRWELSRLKKREKTFQLSIFYGCGHSRDFEERLKKMGYKRTSTRWIKAWKMNSR